MNEEHVDPQPHNDPPAGVPLGGVGAGCIEMGADGRFCNLTINNNRTTQERIPYAGASFLAIRAERREEKHLRILQSDSSIPFESAGIKPPYVEEKDIEWNPLYPVSAYQLKESNGFPLNVRWRGFTPIIPYDLEAATLPLLIVQLEIENPALHTFEFSAMFNWENLRGCTRDTWPDDRGRISDFTSKDYDKHSTLDAQSEGQEVSNTIGIVFGADEPNVTNADANYTLIGTAQGGAEPSFAAWDSRDEQSLRDFWRQFHDEGRLTDSISDDSNAHCGAVCLSRTLRPGSRNTFYFLLGWFAPVYKVNGEDLGNGYALRFADSLDVASYGLDYCKYFSKTVDDWHRRFLTSSLPVWFTRMLFNSSYVLSTNSFYTTEGEFALMESPASPMTGVLDANFYASLGTLLFFPNLAQLELDLLSDIDTKGEPGRVFRHLGRGTLRNPGYRDEHATMLDLGAQQILLACRNYRMTGNRVRLMNIYPRLRETLTFALNFDRDGDALPDMDDGTSVFENWTFHGLSSYVGGLWIAAYQAFSYLANELGNKEDAERCDAYLQRARQEYEERLWNEQEGYYRLYHDKTIQPPRRDDSCLTAQLTGTWMSQFLQLDSHALDKRRVQRTLDTITQRNRTRTGVVKGTNANGKPCENELGVSGDPRSQDSWSYYSVCHLACALVAHGRADTGLQILKSIRDRYTKRRDLQFNQPLSWDTANDCPAGIEQDRHVGSLSVWNMLYALQGFLHSIPDDTLYLTPNLPTGIKYLNVPVFSPVSLGSLTFRVDDKEGYSQSAKLAFESPTHVRHIVLSIPSTVEGITVYLQCDGDTSESHHRVEDDGDTKKVRIELSQTLLVQDSISITLLDPLSKERHETSKRRVSH